MTKFTKKKAKEMAKPLRVSSDALNAISDKGIPEYYKEDLWKNVINLAIDDKAKTILLRHVIHILGAAQVVEKKNTQE